MTYNGADMESFAPTHSYINALEYSSVQQLAKYLEKVEIYLLTINILFLILLSSVFDVLVS